MLQGKEALKALFAIDPGLKDFESDLTMHLERYQSAHARVTKEDTLSSAIHAHLYFGVHRTQDGWVIREWLPGADFAWVYGDFNGWNPASHPMRPMGNGVWELKLSGADALHHGEYLKLLVHKNGQTMERIPAFMRRVNMDNSSWRLCGQIWDAEPFPWTDGDFYGKSRPHTPLIYEAHIGMATERHGVGTYREFAEEVLPWIAESGYNTIQLMAIQEHPYYASFGYQVTNFFAPSHRFGTPEDLRHLINKAHEMGIYVILDVVHSHACPNEGEGLHRQDGTDTQYFLPGDRGWHPAWETRIFDYGKTEVLQFLLSNLKYWQDEFHFDGFRFDGVTSMLYENHGLGTAFTGYAQYYSLNTNVDARAYLMLANELIHENNPMAMTIAEDMSGMPGMCLPIEKGGFGFDYRLSMGVPDLWIKLIKEQRFEDWQVGHLWWELTGGRPQEKTIGYAESHDQAMVGDQTIMFRLAQAEMYYGMEKSYHSHSMDTAMDMHKLIRFLTLSLAGNGYLNFMGNEFGHPEWIDFPREGNGWSYQYARRQWSLVKNPGYKFSWLSAFDRALMELAQSHALFSDGPGKDIFLDQDKNLMIYERKDLIFLVNLHPTRSQENVFVYTGSKKAGKYRVILSSDEAAFGGLDRIDTQYLYHTRPHEHGMGFTIYIPCRSAMVLEKVE